MNVYQQQEKQNQDEKSTGHICFLNGWEYYIQGEYCYRARRGLPVFSDGYRRGRMETKAKSADDHIATITALCPAI